MVKKNTNKESEKINCPKCGKYIQSQHINNHLSQHERSLIKGNRRTLTKQKRKLKGKKKYKKKVTLSPEQRRLKFEKEFGVKEKPKKNLSPSSKFRTVVVNISSIKLYNGFLECTIDNKIFTYRDKSIQQEYTEILDLFGKKKGKILKIKLSEYKIEFSTEILCFINYLEENFNNKHNRQCQVCHLWIKKDEFQDHKRDCKEITIEKKVPEVKRNTRMARADNASPSPLLASSNKREGIFDICNSIQKQRIHEDRCQFQTVGRLFAKDKNGKNYIWWLYNDLSDGRKEKKDITGGLIERDTNSNHSKTYNGTKVSKNSKIVGDLLIAPKAYARMKDGKEVKLKSKANYGSSRSLDAVPVSIQSRIRDKAILWNSLSDLLSIISKITGTVRQLSNSDIIKALLAKKTEAETIEDLFKDAKPFIRNSIKLKSQDILESEQESVKRGNIFDGTTLVIDGGPGTGKTTSLIQRIRFLTSPIAIKEYMPNLSQSKFNQITNTASRNWIFYSPSKLLAKYLKENMIHEGLEATSDYVKVWSDQKNDLLKDYDLIDISISKGEILDQNEIKEYSEAYSFFCLHRLEKKLTKKLGRHLINPKHRTIYNRISKTIDQYGIDQPKKLNLQSIKRFFDRLSYYYDNEEEDVSLFGLYKSYQIKIESIISDIITNLGENEKNQFLTTLSKKKRETSDFDITQEMIKSFNTSLKQISKQKIGLPTRTGKQRHILLPFITNYFTEDFLISFGEIEFLLSEFKHLNTTFINFYFEQYFESFELFKSERLGINLEYNSKEVIWFEDEVAFYISSINESIIEFFNNGLITLNDKHRYLLSYLDHKKNIIAVDEASDLNLFDLKCIYSFRDFNSDLSSVTFCGDIMQRMTSDGVKAWDSLNEIIDDPKPVELKTSFRQSPTLLKLAKRIYQEVTGRTAQYKPYLNAYKGEPKPLLFSHEKLDNRLEWVLGRLEEVLKAYGNNLPATAIFVPERDMITTIHYELEKRSRNNNYQFRPYSDDLDFGHLNNEIVLFSVDQIKGLEFEVVFFFDLQELEDSIKDKDILLRYIYVGLSRAAYYFGMTAPSLFSGELSFLNKELVQNKVWS